MESPALGRLVKRGFVMLAGVTPSDAAHVLGNVNAWDTEAAEKALTLFARKRGGSGDKIAPEASTLAKMIIDQLSAQTVDCLLDAAFAEDDRDWGTDPQSLTTHALTNAGLDQHRGVIETTLKLGVPVIGLGASAASYYGAVGDRLNTRMILPEHAGVANAIGAVVGQVSAQETGTVTSKGPGSFVTLGTAYPDQNAALNALEAHLTDKAETKAKQAGVEDIRTNVARDIKEATIEGQSMFIEATIKVTAQGRPRIANG
jgi:N-methylhydantoinase A/oxoprolinase/acetone carboxylase beta subunit